MKQNRIHYIDLAKGIGIILVILEHWLGEDAPIFSNLILSFHMPLFFILGGVLYKEGPTDKLLIRRIQTLIVPLSVFYCLDFLMKIGLRILHIPFYESVVNIFSLRGGWFVIAIFLSSLLFHLLYIASKGKTWILALSVIIIYAVGLTASYYGVSSESNLKRAFVGLGFYFLGYLLSKWKVADKVQNSSLPTKIFTVSASLTVLLICALWKNDYMVLMYDCDYGSPILFTVKAVLGSAAIIGLCIVIDHAAIIERIGQLSLTVMIVHFPIYLSIKAGYSHLVVNRITSELVRSGINAICIFIVIIVSYFIAALIDRKWPVLAGHWPKNEQKKA